MATNAYLLITVGPAHTQAVGDHLRSIPGAQVREVLGPYDFVVELSVDSEADLASVLRNDIRRFSGVTNSVTCLWL